MNFKNTILNLIFFSFLLSSCSNQNIPNNANNKAKPNQNSKETPKQASSKETKKTSDKKTSDKKTSDKKTSAEMGKAVFAGGCFWCVEASLEKLDGVHDVVSGYTGGKIENPTYKQVSSGRTTHLEAVEVHFDPKVVSYEQLLYAFWRLIDPTDATGSFVDRGKHYSSAIFYRDEEQKKLAEQSKKELADSKKFSKPIATEIRALTTFYVAEEYHQDYYKKSPSNYHRYRNGSGRDQFIKRVWDKKK